MVVINLVFQNSTNKQVKHKLEIDDSTTYQELLDYLKSSENLQGDPMHCSIYNVEEDNFIIDLYQSIDQKFHQKTLVVKIDDDEEVRIVKTTIIVRQNNKVFRRLGGFCLPPSTKKQDLVEYLKNRLQIPQNLNSWTCYSQQRGVFLIDEMDELGDKFKQDTLIIDIKNEAITLGIMKLDLIVKEDDQIILDKIQVELETFATIEDIFHFLKDSYNLPERMNKWICYSEQRGKNIKDPKQKIGDLFLQDKLTFHIQKQQKLMELEDYKIKKKDNQSDSFLEDEQSEISNIPQTQPGTVRIKLIVQQGDRTTELQLELVSTITIVEVFEFVVQQMNIIETKNEWTCYSEQKGVFITDFSQSIGDQFIYDTYILNL